MEETTYPVSGSVHAQAKVEGYTSSTAGRQYCKHRCRTAILQVQLQSGNTATIVAEWLLQVLQEGMNGHPTILVSSEGPAD